MLMISQFHLDKSRSIHEIEHYSDKTSLIKQQKESIKLSQERLKKRDDDVLSHRVFPVYWEDFSGTSNSVDGLRINLKDDECWFDTEEIQTPKGNPKSDFIKKFNEIVDKIDIKTFSHYNSMTKLYGSIEHCDDEEKLKMFLDRYFKWNGFSVDRYNWNVRIKYKMLRAEIHYLNKGVHIYSKRSIGFDERTKELAILSIEKGVDNIILTDYDFNGREFVKKH